MPSFDPLTWLFIVTLALAVFAAAVTTLCSGWTARNTRCRNGAPGPFNRCRFHGGDVVVYDFAGLLLIVAAIGTGLYWLNHQGIAQLMADLSQL